MVTTLKAPFDLSEIDTRTHTVSNWAEANGKVAELCADGTRALGSGSHYPETYTLMYHDAWSSGTAGYTIWRNEGGRHVAIHAIINIS